jgi:hypothetical protein
MTTTFWWMRHRTGFDLTSRRAAVIDYERSGRRLDPIAFTYCLCGRDRYRRLFPSNASILPLTPGRIDALVRVSMMQKKSHARMRARIARSQYTPHNPAIHVDVNGIQSRRLD